MTTDRSDRSRNGAHHGDVSYITLGVPDLAEGREFYGAVLGWHFSPGSSEDGAQVDAIVPMTGLWAGAQPAGVMVDAAGHATVLGFRVDDITAAVAAVRAHGGSVSDPHREAYGMAAEGHDDQGIPFYLHEITPAPGESAAAGQELPNGGVEGDVSYMGVVVPDVEAARAFYGGVFGWTFDIGRPGGAQVSGVAPQIGMTTRREAGTAAPGVTLCYRVDDIAAAVERVLHAGGEAAVVAERPYGLESMCTDNQRIPFYLHQL